jgi:hypothetical protein
MQEVMLKTHLIVTDVHEEYFVKWCGSIANTNPLFKNNMPVFIIISFNSRVELNTVNIKQIEETAKKITNPRGRQAVTTDTAYIYIKEITGKETLIGKVIHNHVKQYQQMYDSFERK